MLKIALVACVVVLAVAQNHGGHNGQHPNIVHGSMAFFEDKHLGDLVMSSPTHCYLYALSDAEKKDIADPEKMFQLELKMVSLANDATKLTDVTDKTDHMVDSRCHGKTLQLVSA